MNKTTSGILCLILLIAGWSVSADQRTPRDLLRGGRVEASAGTEFLDAQIVAKGDDRLLQVLALRRGGGGSVRGLERSGQWEGSLGLWHAYQAAETSWVSNGIVFDLALSASERPQEGLRAAPRARSAGTPRLAAMSDADGRLHVAVVETGSGGRVHYLIRDSSSRWRQAATEVLSEDLSEVCLAPHPQADGVALFGLTPEGRIVEYLLSASSRSVSKTDIPADLRAGSFAVSNVGRYFFFILQAPGGGFRGVERHAVSGEWFMEQQKFMRGFADALGGAALRSLSAFRDAAGLMQVVGLMAGDIVHFYRDEVGTWYNNGVVLSSPGLRRISGDIDGRGLVNVIGLTNDGRIWHASRAANFQWRDSGLLNLEQ
ncbi:MAG: hypothetical protein FJY83_04120 [Candidatus Aminicenantes bacterium]|nr:hypothetical protein [Candidatus Aminicenantes bacterium]